MDKIAPLKIKTRVPADTGLFHDSRGDVREIGKAINILIEKQNEVIEVVNKLLKG